jgi:hypothetical protein
MSSFSTWTFFHIKFDSSNLAISRKPPSVVEGRRGLLATFGGAR